MLNILKSYKLQQEKCKIALVRFSFKYHHSFCISAFLAFKICLLQDSQPKTGIISMCVTRLTTINYYVYAYSQACKLKSDIDNGSTVLISLFIYFIF